MKRKSIVDDDDDQFLAVREDGRAVESGSRFTKIRRMELAEEEEDRISNLPDHILVSILNLMTTDGGKKGEIEQVVRTSLLSRRWRFLWKYYSLKSLTFTFSERDSRYSLEEDSVCEAACKRFVDRVNLILSLPVVVHTIDDFNLTAYSLRHQSDHLPGWIRFALQKRVKRLSINLNYFVADYGVKCFPLDHGVIRNHNMDSLVYLCLSQVDITGQFLEYLLTICGSLEHLSVSDSKTLVDFTVSGPCLKLKYLKIHACRNLQRLCISHVNLVSFDYDPLLCSNNVVVVIEDAPRLTTARLQHVSSNDTTTKVLSYLPCLQELVFAFEGYFHLGAALVFSKLMNLVKVELKLIGIVFGSTICASLLVSCPSMSELVIEFMNLKPWWKSEEKKVERLKHPHECLKMVELVGFIGCKLDTGAALYIIENVVSLEKMVVDTSHPYRIAETRSIAEEVEDQVLQLKWNKVTISERVMKELPGSVARCRAHRYKTDMQERARGRAHAKEHLATRLSGTRTKIVVK